MKINWIWLLLVILLIGGYLYFQKNKDNSPQPLSLDSDQIAHWATYKNSRDNFSIKYPNDLYPTELSSGQLFLFSNEKSAQNFIDCRKQNENKDLNLCDNNLVLAISMFKKEFTKDYVTIDAMEKEEPSSWHIIKHYKDSQERDWTIAEPTITHTNFAAETKIGDQMYSVSTDVGPSFEQYLKNHSKDGVIEYWNTISKLIAFSLTAK